uniref:EamA domain-containing protein n=1 Tax=Globisporangium ultimum (strain ATCC 200006 / CBS 805.95 / DAOM BR144) TaxID=431595 RepID=K3X1A4_GLOUD
MGDASRTTALLTPLALKKMALLGILSVQIGFQPLLMGWFAKDATNVSLRVGVIELMKFVLALVPLMLQGDLCSEMKNWSFHNALQTTAVPALVYVLQNYLNQSAVVVLDGVTFNILNQTKIIWTALLVYIMLRQYQSRQQIVALTILCAAAVLMTTSSSKPKDSEKQGAITDAAFFTGAYQALIAAILSALAGTIIQRALQTQKRNAYTVTIELSVLGELTILIWSMTSGTGFMSQPNNASANVHGHAENGHDADLWDGWTLMTFFALLCQATGGMVVGFVIKYCGNVEKSFAVVFGMIITALLENQYNGKPFGERGLIAIAMVAGSTVLYTMYPPKQENVGPVVTPDKIDATIAITHADAQQMRKQAGYSKKDNAVTVELEPFLLKANHSVQEKDNEDVMTVKVLPDTLPR